MSATGIESVLSRAMSDAQFANQLFSEPEKAIAGFDLTADEVAQLKSMPRAEFDKFAKSTPEERKSFGFSFNHNETMRSI